MDGVLSELRALVELVKTLPHLALWVAIGFWAYKVIIIGSIYGVIRFCADRAYKAYIARLEQKKYSIIEVKDWKGVGVIGNCEKIWRHNSKDFDIAGILQTTLGKRLHPISTKMVS